MMRIAVVGEVRTAEFAFRGVLRAGFQPSVVVTTEVAQVRERSGMAAEYYADLPRLGAEHGVRVVTVEEPQMVHEALGAARPDWALVIGWPYIVPAETLELAPCIGMHPSRLPARRGGAPLNWAVLDGEKNSAVSLLRLRAGVDAGELLAQRDFAIHGDDYASDVLERVLTITEDLVAEAVPRLADGSAQWVLQDDVLATWTRRRTPDDGRIAWNDSAIRIRNLVRATSRPFPGAFTPFAERTLRIWRADVPVGYRAPLRAAPGALLSTTAGGALVATRDNALLITEAQLDGEPPLRDSALARELAPYIGLVLGELAVPA